MKSQFAKIEKTVAKIVICGIVLALAYLYISKGLVGYEANDDPFLGTITSGWYGFYCPYTIYNNIILGKLFAVISSLIPGHNWMYLFYLAIMLFSFMVFGIWCIEKHGTVLGGIFGLIFLFAGWISLIFVMNYSKSGAMVVTVGAILLLDSLDTDDFGNTSKRIFRIIGAVLTIVGALIRYEPDLAVFPFLIVGIVYIVSKYGIRSKQAVYLGSVLLAVLLLWGIDYGVYHLNPEWKEFREYNNNREEFTDYGIPSYENNREIYDEIGWSENDYLMIKQWNYADENVYTGDRFYKLYKYREANEPNLNFDRIVGIIDQFIVVSKNQLTLYIPLFLFVFFASVGSGKEFKYLLAVTLLFVAEFFYLIYFGRINERAAMIPVFALTGFLIYFFNSRDISKKGICIFISAALLFFAFNAGSMTASWELPPRGENPDDDNSIYRYLSENEDNLYLWTITDMEKALANKRKPFMEFEFGIGKNSVPLGGWFVPAPFIQDIEAPFGERNNVFKLLVENPNVYFVSDSNSDNTVVLTYIREHYEPDADFEVVDTYKNYSIFSLKHMSEN